MKKKLIAITVAAAALAPAAAMAEINFYGRIHLSVDDVSGIKADANKVSVNSNSSRFGLKGSQDVGNGLKGIYQIEATVAANGSNGNGTGSSDSAFGTGVRDTFIGLGGGFGTIMTGRLPAANQFVYDSNYFADQLGDAANFTGQGLPGRANGALYYASPDLSGFNAGVTYLPGQSVTSTIGNPAVTGRNSYAVKLNYAAKGITANFAAFQIKSDTAPAVPAVETKVQPMSLAGGYDFGKGSVSAQYVKMKTTTGSVDTNKTSVVNLGGKFNVTDKGTVKAQVSKAGESNSSAKDGATMIAVGYDHSLSKDLGVYVVLAKVSNDTNGTYTMNDWGHQQQGAGPAKGENPSGVGVGITYNF